MKKLICFAIVLLGLICVACADSWVEVKPGKDDLTRQEVKTFAAAFFAKKCGVEQKVFENAEWTIMYGHSSVEKADAAHWVVSLEDSGNKQHRRSHSMRLTGSGEVIEWYAHGMTYDQPYPGLLDYAVPVTPLPTDVQEEAVISLIREEMTRRGQTDGLTFKATFAYDAHFNMGYIPVWLVQIDGAADGSWKAAVTYKGELLSLVPLEQVFLENQAPDEHFWNATFDGQAYHEEQNLLFAVLNCSLSHEEKTEVTGRWRPLVKKWMAEHPYYMNNPGTEYLVTIERVYGVPDERAIPQSEAEVLAGMALTLHLGDAYLQNREVRVDYLVNDPAHPVWVFRFMRIKGLSQEEYKTASRTSPRATSMYIVTVDAYTGEVQKIEETQTIY